MRITNQMMVNNLIQVMGKAELPAQIKELIGKIVEGQVLKVEGQTVTLNIEGNPVEMLNQSTHSFQKGDWVTAEIMNFKEGALFVSVKPQEPESQPNPLPVLLNRLGLAPTPENRALVEALIKFDIPVTKEHVVQMKQALNEVRVLIGELDQLPTDVREFVVSNLDKPIKELVLSLLQKPEPTNHPLSADRQLVEAKSENIAVNSKQVMNQDIPQKAEALMDGLKELMGLDSKSPDISAVKALLENFDFSREGLIMKENLPVTLKSLFLVESVFQNTKTISDSFIKVLEILNREPLQEKSLVALTNILTEVGSDDEKLENIFKWINESELPEDIKREVSKEIVFIRESAQAPKMHPETITYYQFPVQIDNDLKTVDLYMKTKNKTVDKEDMTLLIALQTHHYGEVRCLIHKKNSTYDLSFNLSEEQTRDVFETYSFELEEALQGIGIEHANIRFSINETDFTHDISEQRKSLNKIDLKV